MLTLRSQNAKLLSEHSENLIETLLSNRKVTFKDEAERASFFHPSFEDLHNPFLLDGMQLAVDRILRAREQKERVVIFGDYDVDGVSSTAMLVRFFAEIGMTISYRLPHRVHDGYGMKNHFIDELAAKDVKLIITVDCGTRDIDVIRYARAKWVDVIVSDHHAVPDEIPDEVIAILNPKIPASGYPFSYLSGSGVAFKLLSAVAHTIFSPEIYKEIVLRYADFASLGTIADCMPLIGENRTIASLGLRQLKNTQSNGLRRLIEGKYTDMDADIVGFHIGPRINAAGRMDSPYKALSMLLAWEDRMDDILWELESLNTKRKLTTEYFITHALEVVDRDRHILFYDSTDIEHGIIGLIAWRLTEAFGKPSIALKDEGDKLVASCRSPEHINIVELLDACKHHFVRYGGHRQAAGFTILKENFASFREEIESLLRDRQGGVTQHEKIIEIDAVLPFATISFDFLRELDGLKPYGIGNRKPVFLVQNFPITRVEYLGKDGKHLQFTGHTQAMKINAFGLGEYYDILRAQEKISLIVEIGEDAWMGKKKIVLNVKDIIVG